MSGPLRLRVEPHDADAFERVLDGDQLVVGRAATADVTVPDSLVSRQHARVYRQGNDWWIEDLGARNRTYLNDQELDAPTRLQPGDRFRVGQTVVRVLDDSISTSSTVAPRPADAVEPIFLKTGGVSVDQSIVGSESRQAARLELLNEIHRALATPISLSELLDLILDRCFAVLHPEHGVIMLKEPDGELRRAATRRLPGDLDEILVSRRIIDEVAGKGQSALVLDASSDERFAGSESIIASGVRSVVAAPLIDAEGTMGMIALYSRIRVRRFSQEDLDLLVSLASAAALRVRNVALAEEAAARRLLEHELSLAHDIQMAMLPRQFPRRAEIAIGAALQPARSVGGDLYDVALHGDALWFVVGDVSGKGVAAALYMAVAKTLFRAMAHGTTPLDEVVAAMNQELGRDNEQNMFVTAIVGCLECATGTVTLGDAGHNPPLLVRSDGHVTRPALPKNVALGVMDGIAYRTTAFPLDPGDTLVLYTDGITEARNPAGAQFELERVERALAGRASQAVGALVEGLVADVDQFTAGAPPEDDLTVLAIRFHGRAG